jgi:hypothetical protein
MELMRDSEKNKIKSAVHGVKTIYPWISIAIKLYQTFLRKKESSKNQNSNLLDRIRAWAMNIVQAYFQNR